MNLVDMALTPCVLLIFESALEDRLCFKCLDQALWIQRNKIRSWPQGLTKRVKRAAAFVRECVCVSRDSASHWWFDLGLLPVFWVISESHCFPPLKWGCIYCLLTNYLKILSNFEFCSFSFTLRRLLILSCSSVALPVLEGCLVSSLPELLVFFACSWFVVPTVLVEVWALAKHRNRPVQMLALGRATGVSFSCKSHQVQVQPSPRDGAWKQMPPAVWVPMHIGAFSVHCGPQICQALGVLQTLNWQSQLPRGFIASAGGEAPEHSEKPIFCLHLWKRPVFPTQVPAQHQGGQSPQTPPLAWHTGTEIPVFSWTALQGLPSLVS